MTALFIIINQLTMLPEYFLMQAGIDSFIAVVFTFVLVDVFAIVICVLERKGRRQRLLEFTLLLVMFQMQLRVIFTTYGAQTSY